ncbi:MAG: acetyl-CoA decarbonylase/synthase complex subunit gamma [Desulfovibrionaceae bacterium]
MMALSGLQIHKLLPKTNCKECGSNTCLAFAMKLAQKKASLTECPYASDEAKSVLGAAAEPPVRGVGLGPDKALVVGEETVLHRHEKTFVHQTVLAVNVNEGDDPASVDAACASVRGYVLERVGEQLIVEMMAVTQTGTDPATFAAFARRVREASARPLVIRAAAPEALEAAAAAVAGSGSVLHAATPDTAERLAKAAQAHGCALAVTAPDLNALAACTASLKEAGFADILLAFATHSPAETFQTNVLARRAALKDGAKAMGYPHIRFVRHQGAAGTVEAITEITKYGGVCVLPSFDPAQCAPLLTLRQNVFTDPQKPIQVEPGIYEVGEPGPDAPVFVTTNFSLTYFLISGEIENAGLSAWLVIPECEGMSVLTAWAAGKFNGTTIGKFIKESGLEERITCRTLILPGYVALIKGELEEALPGWDVRVGPQESADMESYVKTHLQ